MRIILIYGGGCFRRNPLNYMERGRIGERDLFLRAEGVRLHGG